MGLRLHSNLRPRAPALVTSANFKVCFQNVTYIFVIIKADNHNIRYVNDHHCVLDPGPEKYDENQPHLSPRQVFSEFSKLYLHISYRPTTCKKLDWFKLLGLLGDLVYKAQKGMLIKEAA